MKYGGVYLIQVCKQQPRRVNSFVAVQAVVDGPVLPVVPGSMFMFMVMSDGDDLVGICSMGHDGGTLM